MFCFWNQVASVDALQCAMVQLSWFQICRPQDGPGKTVAWYFPGHGPWRHPAFREVGLRALHGLFENNMKKYRQQSERISCYILKETSNARCEVEKGCSETPSPCLLYQVMETAVLGSFSNAIIWAKEVLVSSTFMLQSRSRSFGRLVTSLWSLTGW